MGDARLGELKSAVADTLREEGVLAQIQAELRASVFYALDKRGYAAPNEPRRHPPGTNPRLKEFVQTSNGRLVVNLVREFLEHFELGFTDSVLVPEAGLDAAAFPGRDSLAGEIPGVISPSGPLLVSLLTAARQSAPREPTGGSSRPAETAAASAVPGPRVRVPAGQQLRADPDRTPTRAAVPLYDQDATPVASGDDVSEVYEDDFDSAPDDDDDDAAGALPFVTTRRAGGVEDDGEGTEDVSILSGQTDLDYDLVEDVRR